jgi:hypothetical protein
MDRHIYPTLASEFALRLTCGADLELCTLLILPTVDGVHNPRTS